MSPRKPFARKRAAAKTRTSAPRKPAAKRTKEAATLTRQRERLAALNADIAATKLARIKGELVEAVAVEAEWSRILRSVRSGMLAVPTRLAGRLPHLTQRDLAEIDSEVRTALTQLSDK